MFDIVASFDILGLATLLGALLFLGGLILVLVENRSFEELERRHMAGVEPSSPARGDAAPPSVADAEDPTHPRKGAPIRPHRPGRAA